MKFVVSFILFFTLPGARATEVLSFERAKLKRALAPFLGKRYVPNELVPGQSVGAFVIEEPGQTKQDERHLSFVLREGGRLNFIMRASLATLGMDSARREQFIRARLALPGRRFAMTEYLVKADAAEIVSVRMAFTARKKTEYQTRILFNTESFLQVSFTTIVYKKHSFFDRQSYGYPQSGPRDLHYFDVVYDARPAFRAFAELGFTGLADYSETDCGLRGIR